ncbi:CMRF35-like molecule 6 isoform X1 [Clarias gariepinus]|uniref:CMRF35-like molecule 6 isoform X1 n=1 Tax=Clarias gariepinus TaxID=13013 RepID=UPI00234DF4E0|nr:CMRF35-like molecule 6 isoform X1 [Clarias gariepinus]
MEMVLIFTFCLILAVSSVMSEGIRVKGPLGGNASVTCSYHAEKESYPKYFRKGKPDKELARLDTDVKWTRDSRFSLKNDKEKKEFIVTIRNLSVEDAGIYWCGIDYQFWPDFQSKVNLDVVQDTTTENALLFQSTSSASVTRQKTPEAQVQQTAIKDKSIHLTLVLVAIMLLCGGLCSIFIFMKKNKAKASGRTTSKLCGNYTGCDLKNSVYDNFIPHKTSLTIQTPIYATPISRQNQTHIRPSKVNSGTIQSCSAETRLQHPDDVVYSVLQFETCPQPLPQSNATPFTSTQPVPVHYSTLHFEQRAHVPNDTSAFLEESQDVYVTIH